MVFSRGSVLSKGVQAPGVRHNNFLLKLSHKNWHLTTHPHPQTLNKLQSFSHSVHIHNTHPFNSSLSNSFTLYFARSPKTSYLCSVIILKKLKLDTILLTFNKEVVQKCIIHAAESFSSHWFVGDTATAVYRDVGLYSARTRRDHKAGDEKHI